MTDDREEWRNTINDLTEQERYINCGHTRRNEVCPDCGEEADA